MSKLSPMKKVFCYYKSPLGKFTEWAINVVKAPDVDLPVEEGQKSVTIKCPCCVFWRGVLFGCLLSGLVAMLVK